MSSFSQAEILNAAFCYLPEKHPDDPLFEVILCVLPPSGDNAKDVQESFADAIVGGNPNVGCYRIINYYKMFPNAGSDVCSQASDESTYDWYDDHKTVLDQFEGLSLPDKTALEMEVGVMTFTSKDPADAWLMGLTKVWMREAAEEAAEKAIDLMKAAKEEDSDSSDDSDSEEATDLMKAAEEEGSDLSNDSDSNSLDEVEGSQLEARDQSTDLEAPD